MPTICFYFQVHQPYRIKKYRIFDIGSNHDYFNEGGDNNLNNQRIFKKVAQKCYLPANKVILGLIKKYPQFKVSYSFSGVFLDQAAQFGEDVLTSFQKIVDTGHAEVLDETYYHSLSAIYSPEEFKKQVKMHRNFVKNLFGVSPKVFRNTELIYSNQIASLASELGYKGILTEGADHILGWRSPNFVYQPKGLSKIKLLLKNYKLSDDIAFRFSSKDWPEYPLNAQKFANWVTDLNGNGQVINLFMDYETFGEHQWEDTGIFEFLNALPENILSHPDNNFMTPSEVVAKYHSVGELDIPSYISWADVERDLSAWLSNSMQHEAINILYQMQEQIIKSKDDQIIQDWRKLQTSDHFYYMCTKWFQDGDVHKYFNPYETPYDAFISYMNVLKDLELRINAVPKKAVKKSQKKSPSNSAITNF